MQKKQRSASSNIIIVLLILIILAASSIGIFAWAKYRTGAGGTATAQVARWNFTLVDGIAETTDVIDFAVTRTDENPKVEAGTLAPGTYGEFEIGIDARGSETILEYNIEVVLGDKPTNLKLYSDSARTTEIVLEDNKLNLNGIMWLEDLSEIRVEKIYWDWPFETGETEEEILENDVVDSEFLGKTMTMQVAVTGTQLPEMIVFTIEGVTYYAEDGMTWGEWVEEPKYNTGNFGWNGINLTNTTSINDYVCPSNTSNRVTKEDKIYQYDYIIYNIPSHSGGAVD